MSARSSQLVRLAIVLATGLAGVSLAVAAAADDDELRVRTSLDGYSEQPLALSTTGNGSLKLTMESSTQISYRLRYAALEGQATQAHVHFGTESQLGGVSAWLCGTAAFPGPTGTPTCPATEGVVTGTITAASVVGPAAQGIAPGEFAELVKAIQAGATYGNVHTTKYSGGEIRGQLPDNDHDD